jgi:hypothetical protein
VGWRSGEAKRRPAAAALLDIYVKKNGNATTMNADAKWIANNIIVIGFPYFWLCAC